MTFSLKTKVHMHRFFYVNAKIITGNPSIVGNVKATYTAITHKYCSGL